ncbi:MAG: hypothetical protein J6B98_06425 [Bacilli bacterium]|nr:hypothetical protein [Bacilli bacterium]
MKRNIINILITLVYTLVLYYFVLPPINITSPVFWLFVLLVVGFYLFVSLCTFSIRKIDIIVNRKKVYDKLGFKKYFIITGTIFIVAAVIIFINIINTPIFMSKSYYERINITDGDFNTDVALVDFNKLALLDEDSSLKLGDRVMGQMTDLVSQFDVSNLYTQINYKESIVRVTPLEYSGLIKYFTNHKEGVPGYITVNSVNGESNLIRLDNGMKYMPSAIFSEDLYRKLRFDYPTEIFGEIVFEIDNEGKPYWIAQTLKYKAVGMKRDVSGVVILDPVTGESTKYNVEDVPTWVDHVYSAGLIIEQVNDWGSYKNGFLNSLFGQKEVVMTTEGYNYLAMNDDIYLYTGITSVVADESNIGFILTNLRTKETKFYNVAGAEEYSAMDSAKGAVQQMNYTSTFPLIINLNNKPTYLMSLKDNAGLVKMYAFVDYTDYQKVVVTDSSEGILKAAENYLGGNITPTDTKESEIKITSINTAVLDGTTYYYLKANNTYRASLKVNEKVLPFIKVGDTIKITYKEGNINEIVKIED